ncbi:hypothetical protein Bca101_024191 [Brassica carinata]
MTSLSNLANLTPATSAGSSRSSSSSVLPRSFIALRSLNSKLSSISHLSFRYYIKTFPLCEDNICRPVTDILPFISRGVRGATSNPAIFQKAISTSNAYKDQFRTLVQSGKGTF